MNLSIQILLVASIVVALLSIFFGLSKHSFLGCLGLATDIVIIVVDLLATLWTKDLWGLFALAIPVIALIIVFVVVAATTTKRIGEVGYDPYGDYV